MLGVFRLPPYPRVHSKAMNKLWLPAIGALLWTSSATAQEVQKAVFFEHPVELRHAYALDLVGLHLDILELDVPEEDDTEDESAAGEEAEAGAADDEAAEEKEGEEEEKGLFETALPLMAGSLAEQDAELLEGLETAVAAAEAGAAAAAEEARGLIAEVEGVLIPEELSSDVSFRAARLALLSSLEPGVGEGYEEAAQGETEAYYIGYTGLQRAKGMWAELEPGFEGDKENIERAFGVIDELMPSAELPERFSDPEDAEGAVNDMIFGLESLTGATLIPRDFGTMLGTIETHVSEGCSAAEAGNTQLALEWTTAAAFFYDAYLSRTLATLVPEPNERIEEELGELVEEPGSEQTASRCENLSNAFEEVGRIFGG